MDEDDMNQMEELELHSGLKNEIAKKAILLLLSSNCFFCSQESHFRMNCPLCWEAVKIHNHPNHKLALAALKNTLRRQAVNGLQTKYVTKIELSTKSVKAVTKETECREQISKYAGNEYLKTEAEAINKVKQDLATKR